MDVVLQPETCWVIVSLGKGVSSGKQVKFSRLQALP